MDEEAIKLCFNEMALEFIEESKEHAHGVITKHILFKIREELRWALYFARKKEHHGTQYKDKSGF